MTQENTHYYMNKTELVLAGFYIYEHESISKFSPRDATAPKY